MGICWQVLSLSLSLLGSLLVVSGSSDFWFLRLTNSCFTPQVLHVRACISYTRLLSYCPYELQNKTSADFTATIFHFKLTVAHSPCFCYSACHIFYSHFTVVSGSSLLMRSSKSNAQCHSTIFVLPLFHDGSALMLDWFAETIYIFQCTVSRTVNSSAGTDTGSDTHIYSLGSWFWNQNLLEFLTMDGRVCY